MGVLLDLHRDGGAVERDADVRPLVSGVVPFGLSIDAIRQELPQIGQKRVPTGVFVLWSGYLAATVLAPILAPVVGIAVTDLRCEKVKLVGHQRSQVGRIGG